ncbi:hypothetical protein GAY29_04100 [Azospirillum brasilense]|uniref:hypothetical protein n=1 Tax=Azospirillum brasilense TaxID=192 RepID=UPI00190B4021|nr:hypothetical protein [Azospirillum brasilense]MBK3732293.1 hypothetical protein [Azospirillum brasilense]
MIRLPNDFLLNEGDRDHSMGVVASCLARRADGGGAIDEDLVRAACFWLENETNDDDQDTFLNALTVLSKASAGSLAHAPHVLSRIEALRLWHQL